MTTAVFEILAEPNRRHVLDLLREQEHTVGELVDARLDEAGVAQHRVYSLRPEPLAEIDAWLAPYRKFWRGRLASLQRHVAGDDRPLTGEQT